jgi:hypothetical protein
MLLTHPWDVGGAAFSPLLGLCLSSPLHPLVILECGHTHSPGNKKKCGCLLAGFLSPKQDFCASCFNMRHHLRSPIPAQCVSVSRFVSLTHLPYLKPFPASPLLRETCTVWGSYCCALMHSGQLNAATTFISLRGRESHLNSHVTLLSYLWEREREERQESLTSVSVLLLNTTG